MPRKERKHNETGIYHVMLSGINRQDIFDIYAYCLMPNHVHLLLCEKNWKVGDVIKSKDTSTDS